MTHCKVNNCSTGVNSLGYCATHLYRYRRYSDPLVTKLKRNIGSCRVSGCTSLAKTRGWCKLHWQHWYRTGDPTMTRHEMHGGRRLPEYYIWCAMKTRCSNPNDKAYGYYGGRGIKVCTQWLKSFRTFMADMGRRPEGYWIERVDNDGNYEPSNCKWASPREQRLNQRRSHGNSVGVSM